MIIGAFVVDLHSDRKLYRSSLPMSSSKMNYYLTEFNSLVNDSDGIIERETYNYAHISNNLQRIGIQITKNHSIGQANSLLKFIEQNSTGDIFDMLFTIDNILFGGINVNLDLQSIKEMDSQEEKIFKMMLENKKLEMAQREKESKLRMIKQQMEPDTPVKQQVIPETKVKRIEKSSEPVLLIIKEKIKIQINKDNKIVSNSLSGEIDLVIYDQKYRQIQIKMKNLIPSLKYSPYLDKNALKKQTLKFEKDRGLNKNIPVLKWTGACAEIPITFDFWCDEDDDKFVNIIEFKAHRNIKDLEFRFNNESISDVEIEGDFEENKDNIVWRCSNINKNETKTLEIRCNAFSKDSLFPIEVRLASDSLDTNLSVEKMYVEENEIEEYEVRKIFETDEFVVKSE